MNPVPSNSSRVIVVGMDGSTRSDAALRWALTSGAHPGDTVRAIMVRSADSLLPGTSFALQPHGRTPEGDYSFAEHVTKIADECAAGPVDVTASTPHGDAATELITASADADLLVVGSHRGGLTSDLLMGSVSRECVRYSRCPVVVINPQAANKIIPASVG